MRVRRLPPRRAAAQIKQLMRSALVLMYACLGRVAGLTFARRGAAAAPRFRAVATDADLEKALSAKSPFLREFAARGYLAQCTDIEGLDEKLTEVKSSRRTSVSTRRPIPPRRLAAPDHDLEIIPEA